MASFERLVYDIIGRDRGASKALNDVANAADRSGKSADEASKASDRLAAAQKKQADAAGVARVEELRLKEIRDKVGATDLEIADAEERVARARRNTVAATADVERANRGLASSQQDLSSKTRHVTDDFIEFDKATTRIKGSLGALGSLTKLSFGALGTQAAVGGLVALTAAAAPAAGALALLPAAGLAAAAPMGALALGMVGVGDALKAVNDGDPEKLAESLGKLAPSARDTVLAIQGVKPAFDSMRLDVQQQLFEGMSGRVQDLASTYLPILRESLRGFAADINYAGQRVAGFLTMPATANDLTAVLANARVAFGDLMMAARPLVQIFTDIAVVGSTFLPGLTGGLGAATQRMADFVREARNTGELSTFISNALSILGQLGQVLFNVGGIIVGVFRAGQEVGGGFLNTLQQVTGRVAEFVNSFQGQTALRSFFDGVAQAVSIVIPLALQLGGVFLGLLAPALAQIAVGLAPLVQALIPLLVSVLNAVLPILISVADWLGRNAEIVVPLALGIGSLIGSVNLIIGVLRTWTIVQGILNAVLAANPILLIVALVAALVVALITAYQTSDTFRAIVDAAFRAVAEAGRWMWDNVLKPVFDALRPAFDAVAAGISSAWTNVISPALSAFSAYVLFMWNNVIQPYLRLIWDLWVALANIIAWVWQNIVLPALNAWATVVAWLWNNVLNPVFSAIGAAWSAMATGIKWAWDNVLNPVWEVLKTAAQVLLVVLVGAIFGPILVAWEALTAGIKWAYENVLQPTWNALQAAAQWMWSNVLQPVFSATAAGWNLILTAMNWAWENVLRPTWDALQAAAGWLWNNVLSPIFTAIGAAWSALSAGMRGVYDGVLKPMFDAFSGIVSSLKGVFETVVGAIGVAWDQLKGVAAAPVRFVIDTVINNGLIDAFNKVVGWFGLDSWKVSRVPMPAGLAAGGKVPGWSPNDKADNIPAMLTAGEWVQPVNTVDYYGTDVMERIRRREIPRDQLQHLATGGEIFNLAKANFPAIVLTSGYRPGDPGYHGSNQAADLSGGPGYSQAGSQYLALVKRYFVDNFGKANEIIYNGVGMDRPNIKNGAPLAYSAAIQAQHRNHVHVAIAGALAAAAGAGGAGAFAGASASGSAPLPGDPAFWADPLGWLKSSVAGPLGQMANNPFTNFVKEIPGKLVNAAWEKVKDKVSELLTAGSSNSEAITQVSGPVQEQVRQVFDIKRSWGSGPQWTATSNIVQKESGWNPNAQNPSSTASGLFQHIDGTWRAYRPAAASGFAKMRLAPANLQAEAGVNYIAARYGSPVDAWRYWQAHGNYANGGLVMPSYQTGTNYVPITGPALLHRGEAVVPATQNQGAPYGGMSGLEITGTLEIGGDGLARIIDGRVVGALTGATDRMRLNA